MNHGDFVPRWLRGRGTEIGAFKSPIPGIRPVYVDKFDHYAGEKCLADLRGDANSLPFPDESLDYVATSHVLEHLANPIAALKEWCRVLRPGGIIYLVVPDKKYTWDRTRATTTVEHLLEDYRRATSPVDATHIDEFLDGVVLGEYFPQLAPADAAAERERMRQLYHASVQAGLEINIHFHVFDLPALLALVARLNADLPARFQLEVVATAEQFPATVPNGFLCVLRVRKSPWHRARAAWRRLRAGTPDGRSIAAIEAPRPVV